MTLIFVASSIPSDDMPSFDTFDTLIKKGGHMIGYGLLALAYLYGLQNGSKRTYFASWLFAVLYACTDEFHQSFVAGRGATFWDVILFDATGAALALFLFYLYRRNKNAEQSAPRR
jgi:VanZ family protein